MWKPYRNNDFWSNWPNWIHFIIFPSFKVFSHFWLFFHNISYFWPRIINIHIQKINFASPSASIFRVESFEYGEYSWVHFSRYLTFRIFITFWNLKILRKNNSRSLKSKNGLPEFFVEAKLIFWVWILIFRRQRY